MGSLGVEDSADSAGTKSSLELLFILAIKKSIFDLLMLLFILWSVSFGYGESGNLKMWRELKSEI